MGDMGELWNAVKDDRQKRRAKYGMDCPQCNIKQPKRIPTILLPRQRCKVCGYVDKRKREAQNGN